MSASDDVSAPVSWPTASPLPLDLLHALIRQHAPVIHFHPDEVYFPATAEWYLTQVMLIDGPTGNVLQRAPLASDLPAGPGEPERYWLTLDPELAGPALDPELAAPNDPRRGKLDAATAYVRAVHNPAVGYTDLQFWMFYAFDGPGLLRLRPFALTARRADALFSLWPGGMHEADWELAVLRIDHANLQPIAAFLSQHKDGDVHAGETALAGLERDPAGRIQLYASLYGHATYAHADERKLFYLWRSLKLVGLEMALVDQASRGACWELGADGGYQLISVSWPEPALSEPAWLAYGWRWGAYAPKAGRFTRKLVDGVTALLEMRMASLVLALLVLSLGLLALVLALASRLLGGAWGTGLLGQLADNSGPLGPRWQEHKWQGNYGFSGPPPPHQWRMDGHRAAHWVAEAFDIVSRPPVRLLGWLLRLLLRPFLHKD